eukprot:gene5950-5819_t
MRFTLFTVGHSLTLALLVLGWIAVPTRAIEAWIALSVLWLAWELVRKEPAQPSNWSHLLLIAAFGLLHGSGFALSMEERGFPQDALLSTLLLFNLGIEIGQLWIVTVLATAFTLLEKTHLPNYTRFAQYALTLCIGGAALPAERPDDVECLGSSVRKQAFFGDLHIHTKLSFDAYFFNSINGPREAYQFAKGENAFLPSGEDPDTPMRQINIGRPLDFAAVTEHAEQLGTFSNICELQGNLPAGTNPACAVLGQVIRDNVSVFITGNVPLYLQLVTSAGSRIPSTRTWEEIQAVANAENQPCKFTTFNGYEFSSNKGGQVLHRNVIFEGTKVPGDVISSIPPIPTTDNTNDEWGLFDRLKTECLDVEGCDVVTIPHSTNQSDGRFARARQADTGLPLARNNATLTAADATLRNTFDRLFEIVQHKGASECITGFNKGLTGGEESGCGFEEWKTLCKGNSDDPAECAKRVFNPVASNFTPGGLAGVWARENTRKEIFAALKRRETFATSGSRMRIRTLASSRPFPTNICEQLASGASPIEEGLVDGVPMGGTLNVQGSGPYIVAYAIQDPGGEEAGNPLDGLSDGLHVGLCGTGSPFPDPQRAAPCTLVIAGKDMFLFDAGSAAAKQIANMNFSTGQLKGVFITHFHSDHIDGLGEVLMTRWAQHTEGQRLTVHGPTGVSNVLNGFKMAYEADNGYRTAHHGAATMPPELAGADVNEFTVQKGSTTTVLQQPDLLIEAFAVNHQPINPAVGYRISYKGRTVVLSGDTTSDEQVKNAARKADLLVHEALSPELVARLQDTAIKNQRSKLAKIFSDIPNYH